MSLLTLDLVEAATIVSSLGTLAIALTSMYQIRCTLRDSFFPLLAVDHIESGENGELSVIIRNYGTGPALHVQFEIRDSGGAYSRVAPHFDTYSPAFVHFAMNESKDILLDTVTQSADHAGEISRSLKISYESVRHMRCFFTADIPSDSTARTLTTTEP